MLLCIFCLRHVTVAMFYGFLLIVKVSPMHSKKHDQVINHCQRSICENTSVVAVSRWLTACPFLSADNIVLGGWLTERIWAWSHPGSGLGFPDRETEGVTLLWNHIQFLRLLFLPWVICTPTGSFLLFISQNLSHPLGTFSKIHSFQPPVSSQVWKHLADSQAESSVLSCTRWYFFISNTKTGF